MKLLSGYKFKTYYRSKCKPSYTFKNLKKMKI